MTPFATLADLEVRHPSELTVLAADEMTGVRDDVRIQNALDDASAEMRGILKARYSAAELERLDADSRETLRVYAMQIALYLVSLSFARQTETIQERYNRAIKRLEAIAAGKGAVSFDPDGSGAGTGESTSTASPNEVLIDVPERVFTRRHTRGL